MKKYIVYQIDAFTKNRLEGNPAGVVVNADGLTEQQMQSIARELNNSETAFLLSPTASDHDVWVRFFTPATEVPTCGHATISAHYVNAIEKNLQTCTIIQRIGIGVLPVDIIKEESDYRIIMTQGDIEVSDTLEPDIQNQIINGIGLKSSDLDNQYPIQISSTGHSKVMIGIKSRNRLNNLNPDFLRLTTISKNIGCNGYYVFTFDSHDKNILVHGRMFAPAIGILEDPVTGNANGPLGAYLVHNRLATVSDGRFSFNAKQGEAMERPGIINVTVEVEDNMPMKVQVGGHAVVAFKTEIEIGK